MSPELAGGFLTTVPPGKSPDVNFNLFFGSCWISFVTLNNLLNFSESGFPYLLNRDEEIVFCRAVRELVIMHVVVYAT